MGSIKDLSAYRLEKAKKNLEVVKLLIEDEYYNNYIKPGHFDVKTFSKH